MYSVAAIIAAVALGVHAAPRPEPQGVTALIAPPTPAPAGCSGSFSGSFGVAVMNATGSAAAAVGPATQAFDGQPAAVSGSIAVAPVSQISDAQPQAATAQPTVSVAPVSQINDAQPQAPTKMAMISMIGDGQIQAATSHITMAAVGQIGDGQVQAPTVTLKPVSQINDGQPQAATVTPVSQIPDAQPQAPTAQAVSQISDAQPQAPTANAVSQIADAQPQAGTVARRQTIQLVACSSASTLALTLNGGVLKDGKGRTGYVASNQQFQFDDPPQAGAIFTSGFSVCSNGSLALGGSAIFYQCLSGTFFNLYTASQGLQCNPVTINALTLESCT
ncbi:MAG: hypothetical protein M1838_002553 [Thelocarpon superellum]|nr:MAG: hypothetical protein M1838_002553 [Thelocarpon superellum]